MGVHFVPFFFFWTRFHDEWLSRNIQEKLVGNKLWNNLSIEMIAKAEMPIDNDYWVNIHSIQNVLELQSIKTRTLAFRVWCYIARNACMPGSPKVYNI